MKVIGNIVYQDNHSAMKLEKNGRASRGKRTRHINIRYFFVTDRIQANKMSGVLTNRNDDCILLYESVTG